MSALTLADTLPATAGKQDAANAALGTIASPFAAATAAPLTATIADTQAHLVGPFAPQLAREIVLQLVGTGASGTAQLLRSIDGGATAYGVTAGGALWASHAFANVTGAIVNEAVWTESSALATFYLAITLTAGSVSFVLHQ